MEKLLFVGLGNAGSRFQGTRHNLGIEVLRRWVEANQDAVKSGWQVSTSGKYESAEMVFSGRAVVVLFPLTMMNNSGEAVGEMVRYKQLESEQILLVHDDMELKLGEVRMGQGSAKGHNGVRSVQTVLDSQAIQRLRLGIGRPEQGVEPEQFVLQGFSGLEHDTVEKEKIEAVDILTKVAVSGTTQHGC